MNYKKTNEFLNNHSLTIDESFPDALRKLSKTYKNENKIALLDDVYKLIGTSKQDISWWKNHPLSTQTKKNISKTSYYLRESDLI